MSGDAQTKSWDKFDAILEEARLEAVDTIKYYIGENPSKIKVFKEQVLPLPPNEKINFILDCIHKAYQWNKGMSSYKSNDIGCQLFSLRMSFLNHLFKTKLILTEPDCVSIGKSFLLHNKLHFSFLNSWPINSFINQIQKIKKEELSESLKEVLVNIKMEVNKTNHSYYEKEIAKITDKIDGLLHHSENGKEVVKPQKFLGKDAFNSYGNQVIQNLPSIDQIHLYKILARAQGATGSKPTVKFLTESKKLIQALGEDKFRTIILDWFGFLNSLKEVVQENSYTYSDGTVYNYTSYEFLSSPNIDALKGLAWMCLHVQDSTIIKTLATLADKSYRKIPGRGPAAAALGNACLYVLSKTAGMTGIAQLSRLKLRIKQSNTQTLIEKFLHEAAQEQGVSVHEIEDLAVDTFGLIDGKRTYSIEGFTGLLEVVSIGKTELKWFKPDGSPQKTVPTIVKEKHGVLFKEIKETAKQIELTLSAQRDRLDRQFKASRQFSWEYFNQYYFSHGLMSFLVKRIIWCLKSNGTSTNVIFQNHNWVTPQGHLFQPSSEHQVEMWHPALVTVAEIRDWREFLLTHKILQPFKQAYREVYLLTDAEVNTRTYSNRMAAHLIKQHQFNSLAKIRGWKYSLLGCYDDGRSNEAATILLPDYNLRAEFWVNEVNADDAYNETGIWYYVATDQVRFVNLQTDEVLLLVDVPVVPFSEVMRDVDLFVGVGSVGNDPNWQDTGGLLPFRDYWHAYSFGELSEVAKTRKEILQGLIPRLKLAKVAEIIEKFLVVKGKYRTYKIHLGSTNILMEPNDQYLCIVPDRSKKNLAENVFLPFEGDTGLSVILSKAFLLAEDDKISDSTITSQILRK